MSERLYQRRFDEQFQSQFPQEVTPQGFEAGFLSPQQDLGRFVAETRQHVQVTSPQVAARYLKEKIYVPFEAFDQEEVWVLLLDIKNNITHEAMVYRGTVHQALIRPAEIFKPAVRLNAPALILSHCHPSGDPTPSPEDVLITRSLIEAGELLSIEVLDHIIVGRGNWISLKERGGAFG